MRTYLQSMTKLTGALLALACLAAPAGLSAADDAEEANQSSHASVVVAGSAGGAGGATVGVNSGGNTITISSIEPVAERDPMAPKERSWLGVSIEEGSEALAAQLDLAPGTGLVVTYVAPDSPAAKAGLGKNDVLVELDGQLLVVPAQLRKLVQVRKEGDKIELVYYRAGKKQTATATLGKAPAGFGQLGSRRAWDGEPEPFRNLIGPDGLRWEGAVRDILRREKINPEKLGEQLRHSMELARKAWQDAVRHSSNAAWAPALRMLEDVYRSGMDVDDNASVTVRSTGKTVKSLVKADESGTIVLVCNPKPRLTAHDKDGKLVFDGEIDTPEQRAKVPPELWEKVEPMLDKLSKPEKDKVGTSSSRKGTSLLPKRPPIPPRAGGPPTL